MKSSEHKYDIPPDIMVSSRAYPNEYLATEGIVYSCDKHGDSHAIVNMFNDFTRGANFFGWRYEDSQIESPEALASHLETIVPPEPLKMLYAHYSQGPMLFMSAPIASITSQLIDANHTFVIKEPSKEDREFNYILKDNEIYFQGMVKRHPIVNLENNELIGYVDGKTESQFHLMDNGFNLTSFQTNSRFIHDVYINTQLINPKRLEMEIAPSQTKLKEEEKILQDFDKKLQSYFKHLSQSLNKQSSPLPINGLGDSLTDTNSSELRANIGQQSPAAIKTIIKIEILMHLKSILSNESHLPNYKIIDSFNKTLREHKLTLSLHQNDPTLFRASKSHGQKFVDSIEENQKNRRNSV